MNAEVIAITEKNFQEALGKEAMQEIIKRARWMFYEGFKRCTVNVKKQDGRPGAVKISYSILKADTLDHAMALVRADLGPEAEILSAYPVPEAKIGNP